jgi:hypothetical protein
MISHVTSTSHKYTGPESVEAGPAGECASDLFSCLPVPKMLDFLCYAPMLPAMFVNMLQRSSKYYAPATPIVVVLFSTRDLGSVCSGACVPDAIRQDFFRFNS